MINKIEVISTSLSENLSDEYWDCECEENYIHSVKSEFCRECGSLRENQPNSRSEEVIAMLVLNKITKGYRT